MDGRIVWLVGLGVGFSARGRSSILQYSQHVSSDFTVASASRQQLETETTSVTVEVGSRSHSWITQRGEVRQLTVRRQQGYGAHKEFFLPGARSKNITLGKKIGNRCGHKRQKTHHQQRHTKKMFSQVSNEHVHTTSVWNRRRQSSGNVRGSKPNVGCVEKRMCVFKVVVALTLPQEIKHVIIYFSLIVTKNEIRTRISLGTIHAFQFDAKKEVKKLLLRGDIKTRAVKHVSRFMFHEMFFRWNSWSGHRSNLITTCVKSANPVVSIVVVLINFPNVTFRGYTSASRVSFLAPYSSICELPYELFLNIVLQKIWCSSMLLSSEALPILWERRVRQHRQTSFSSGSAVTEYCNL